MINKISIIQLAEIITGYPFRTSLGELAGDDIMVVQAKDILVGSDINLNNAFKIAHQNFNSKSLLKKGDVVLSVRGKFRASVIKEDINNIIASSSVYVLRITYSGIIPEYLSIYLNSRNGQKQINERISGAVIKTILKSDLANLQIAVPSLEIQNQIIKIYNNNQCQQKLLTQKQFLTNKITEGAINKLLN